MNNVFISTNELPEWLLDRHFKDKDLVSIDEIICLLEDLSDDLEHMTEKYEDLNQDLIENYKFVGQEYWNEP